jgi:hypothetical protein
MVKKERDHSSSIEKPNTGEERRSSTSKHYTTEWIATQKPEEAVAGKTFNSIIV